MIKSELQDLANTLNNPYGFNTIYRILKKLGAFESGINRETSTKEDYLTLGKREQGAWLLRCVLNANKNKYIQIVEKESKEN